MPPVDPNPERFPPWGAPRPWREANTAMVHAMARLKEKPGPARAAARTIQDRLQSLFPLLDALCLETCPHCPAPCCLDARIWIDFKDLLFLHLTGQPVPTAQLIADRHSRCIGIGHSGCTLPRFSRPWVCTWYLCPAQTLRLGRRPETDQRLFAESVRAIKSFRKKMENDFIRAVF